MELHRQGFSVLGGIFVVGGIVLLFTDWKITGVAALALGGWMIYRRLLPFRFHIGPDGLTVRTKGLNRLVVWSEIHAVVLAGEAPITKLLLVPATSSFDAKLKGKSPVDARPCLEILNLDEVKETPAEVAEALSRFGGERFVDARGEVERAGIPDFSVQLRGYDQTAVQALAAQAELALREESGESRAEARAQLEAKLADGLPIAMRGYDRAQVDKFLNQTLEQLR